jgi:hypothetical protein
MVEKDTQNPEEVEGKNFFEIDSKTADEIKAEITKECSEIGIPDEAYTVIYVTEHDSERAYDYLKYSISPEYSREISVEFDFTPEYLSITFSGPGDSRFEFEEFEDAGRWIEAVRKTHILFEAIIKEFPFVEPSYVTNIPEGREEDFSIQYLAFHREYHSSNPTASVQDIMKVVKFVIDANMAKDK